MSQAAVDSETFCHVSGQHQCGDIWISFKVQEKFVNELAKISEAGGKKLVVVGSWWLRALNCGVSLRTTVISSLDEHEEDGKRFFSSKNGNPQLRFEFIGGGGKAKFDSWSNTSELFFI
jgi:hypothetical protein